MITLFEKFFIFYCAYVLLILLDTTQGTSSEENERSSASQIGITDEKLADFLAKCDRKKHLYFAPKKSCYHIYSRGPCNEGEYLVYSRSDNSVKCEKNPCKEDGKIQFNDHCYKLNSRGPCDPWDAVVINKKTLQIECGEIDLSEVPLFSRDEPCPKGYYRSYIICRKLT